MNVTIESPGMDLRLYTEGIIEKKLEKLSRLFNKIEKCDVTVRKEAHDTRDNFVIEAKVYVPGAVLFAKELSASIESAANEVAIDLESQLRKYKDRLYQKR